MNLLVDEDTQARILVKRLRDAGHDVLTVNEAELQGQPDAVVFASAIELDRVLLTRNGPDFLPLADEAPDHPGVLAIYQDADPSKNMSYADIVQALGNLVEVGTHPRGLVLTLNAYRW